MRLLLTAILSLVSLVSFGQIQDLSTLAEGKVVFHNTLYDSDENLYGYIYIYERDADDRSKVMEYVILDKNLNKVANHEYIDKQYKKVSSFYFDCTLMGDYIILNKYYYYENFFTGANPLLSTYLSISIKENTISPEFKFENNEFKELIAEYEYLKSDYKSIEQRPIVRAFNNQAFKGFYIQENIKNKDYLEKDLKFYNEKRELLWNYQYNTGTDEYSYQSFFFLHAKDSNLYICVVDWKGTQTTATKAIEHKIVALDLKTGKKKFEYILQNDKSDYRHSIRMREINDKIYIVGDYCAYKAKLFGSTPDLGFYRIVLDKEGKELERKYNVWSDFMGWIDIDKGGKLDNIYPMRQTKAFIFSDGSVTFMNEKLKTSFASQYYLESDFILFNMKPDFSVADVLTIKKGSTSLGSEYLFSQYIKDDTGVVFFHRDIEGNTLFGEKKFFLGINTLIKGKLVEEKIPLSQKKKFYIEPHPAKEGYIMLREYNEEQKYNQIRLEKLNY